MKKTGIIIVITTLLALSCKKKDTSEPESSPQTTGTTTTGSNPGAFTPPTANYFILSDSAHTPNASIASCDMNGGSFGVSKSFSSLGINPGQLRIFFDSLGSSTYRNIRVSVAEGSYRVFEIDTVPTTITNKVNVEFDAGEGDGYYYYKAMGKIYVSKKNNKLRFTSEGVLQMKGKKYLGPGFTGSIYTRTLKFSIEEGVQF